MCNFTVAFGLIFPNVPSSLEESLRALNRGLSALFWLVICTSQVRLFMGKQNHYEAMRIVMWVSVFTEGGECSPLGDGSLAKRNVNMSFVNLEKRPQRPQVKNYITIDIYKKKSTCIFMDLVLWIKIIWRQRKDIRKNFITKI